MSHLRMMKQNTREKVLSTDLNNISYYLSKDIQNILRDLFRKWDTDSLDVQDGVLYGFDITVSDGPNRVVSIAPGIAFKKVGSESATTSDYKLIYSDAAVTQTIDANATAEPRIDLIEVCNTTAEDDYVSRDIYNIGLGAFVATDVYKRIEPSATIHYVVGEPGAGPQFPATTAGYIPLAYVYVAATTYALIDADLFDARVLIFPGNKKITNIYGFETSSYNLLTSAFLISDGHGTFLGEPLEELSFAPFVTLSTFIEDGVATAASTWYYVYLVKPSKIQKSYPFQGGVNRCALAISTTPPLRNRQPDAAHIGTLISYGLSADRYEDVAAKNCYYIGCIKTDGSKAVQGCVKTGQQVAWDMDWLDTRILDGGTSTSWTAISCTDLLPEHADVGHLYIQGVNSDLAYTRTVFVGEKSGGALKANIYLNVTPATSITDGQGFTWGSLPVSNQHIDYKVSNANIAASLYVLGFNDIV